MNGSINAFITILEQSALDSARIVDDELRAGKYRGQLHGIPVAVKDLFDTRGVRTTAGTKLLAENIPNEDATVIRKLRDAGSVLIGKLNLHEWALGVTNINPHYGAVMNPWNADRISGGSSGGSAAATASRLCAASLGTDTGGSIRIPASFCGVVGLKPTYGCVSLKGAIPLSWSLDHVGPITRTAEDAAIMFSAIRGYDEFDPVSRPHEFLGEERLESDVEELRLVVPNNYFFDKVDEPVVRAIRSAVSEFESHGAQVTENTYGEVEADVRSHGIVLLSEAAAYHRADVQDHPEDFGEDVLARLQSGLSIPSVEYVLAQRRRAGAAAMRSRLFQDSDIMVTPTTPNVAPPKNGLNPVDAARKLTRLTSPFNFAGLPAISIPCGFTSDCLPIGMQLVAGPWKEMLLLRAAFAYQSFTDWHRRVPGLFRVT